MWSSAVPAIDWDSVEKELKTRYTILRVMGEGGMGRAYSVKDSTRADKVVKTTLMLDDRDMNMEYDFLVKVRHPNIANVYMCLKVCNMLAMEMHCYKGGDLHLRLHQEQIDNNKMAPILRDILCGLTHIHHKKIVHRDMKPANILFDTSGSALITDFGLAAIDANSNLSLICGTAHYQAPEMLDHKLYGSAVDIFAVGVIVRAICGMNANDPPLFVDLGFVLPWVKSIYDMTSADVPEKRRNAASMCATVDSVLVLIGNAVQLDSSTFTFMFRTDSHPEGNQIEKTG